MASITALTTGVQTVTATGAVTPTAGVSISATTGPATVCIECISLTAGKTARVQLEDSTNGFTASNALAVFHFIGQEGQGGTSFTAGAYNPTTDKRHVQKFDLANNVFGTSNAVIRFNVTAIDSGASLSINGWLES